MSKITKFCATVIQARETKHSVAVFHWLYFRLLDDLVEKFTSMDSFNPDNWRLPPYATDMLVALGKILLGAQMI